ncbi:tetratricopeptide repeat protein [Aquimarina sp. M1]
MNRQNTFLISALVLTFLVLIPTLWNDWTNLDDPMYVLDNLLVKDLSRTGIKRMFTTLQVNGSYNPIVLLSWALDYSFVGLNPMLYHMTNLIIHLLVVVLVYYLGLQLTNHTLIAFGISLLFGIHPMHVESVAWITSRKELLYTLFYFAGLLAYFQYLKKDSKYPSWYNLVCCFIFYLLSLLSKGSAVTFPLILWMLDYFTKRKETYRLILEKIPFIVLSIGFTYFSIKAQREGEALQFRAFYSVIDSLSVGFYGYLTYLIKAFIPYHLSAIHPYPTPSGTPSPWYFAASAIPVLTIAIYGLYKIKTARKFVFGFGFFFITLIPVIQVLSFAVSVTADRFTYLPYFGIFYIMVTGVVRLSEKYPAYQKIIKIVVICFVGILSGTTFSYAQTFKNSETLWSRVIKYYPDYFVSYVNRSEYRINQGQLRAALEDCNLAITLKPDYYLAYYNRAFIYQRLGEQEKALQDYTKTIQLNNELFEAYQNRGILYVKLNRLKEALQDFNKSIKLKPDDPMAYLNRALLYERESDYHKALKDANTGLSINNAIERLYLIRAKSLLGLGYKNKAIKDYTKAISLNGSMVKPFMERGNLLLDLGYLTEARLDFTKSLELDRSQVNAYINLGIILMNQSLFEEALFQFNQAQNYAPDNALIYLNRGILYKLTGDYKEALKDLDKSIQLDSLNNLAIKQKDEVTKLLKIL